MSEEQVKQYLFQTATNLLRDRWRRGQGKVSVTLDDVQDVPAAERTAESVQARSDLHGALRQLKPRDMAVLLAFMVWKRADFHAWLGRLANFGHSDAHWLQRVLLSSLNQPFSILFVASASLLVLFMACLVYAIWAEK